MLSVNLIFTCAEPLLLLGSLVPTGAWTDVVLHIAVRDFEQASQRAREYGSTILHYMHT